MLRDVALAACVTLCGCQALLDFGSGPSIIVIHDDGAAGDAPSTPGADGAALGDAAAADAASDAPQGGDAGHCDADVRNVVTCDDFDDPAGTLAWNVAPDSGPAGRVVLDSDASISSPRSLLVVLDSESTTNADMLVAARALDVPLGPEFVLSFRFMRTGALQAPTTIAQLSFDGADGTPAAVSIVIDENGNVTVVQAAGANTQPSAVGSVIEGAWYDFSISAAPAGVHIELRNRGPGVPANGNTGQVPGFANATVRSLQLGFVATTAPHGDLVLRFDDVLVRRL